MKPSFLKLKKVGKGPCKCLIVKVEKSARGENAALMKKGLRLQDRESASPDIRENAALKKKGFKNHTVR